MFKLFIRYIYFIKRKVYKIEQYTFFKWKFCVYVEIPGLRPNKINFYNY